MAGKVLNLQDVLLPDNLAVSIARQYIQWNIFRQKKLEDWKELRRYVYATDTTTTSNSALPWKNKTTIPKLCQIRDNLHANYVASMFPKRKWLVWEGDGPRSNDIDKKTAIEAYMSYVLDQPEFKKEISKCVLDYIDTGNAFCTVDWLDGRVETKEGDHKIQVGYVGPVARRINPADILFNPIAPDFRQTPKIEKSLVSRGEVKKMLDGLSTPDNVEQYKNLWTYMREWRRTVSNFAGEIKVQDDAYMVDGFTSYRAYLESDYVELLTFYGDIYDHLNDKLYENYIICIADRHKIMYMRPNPSLFGDIPIYHTGWRIRQDNLWAMGPLENLVGMQYRIDHIENLKADVFDLTAFPVLKIKGYVEDFKWGPFERINIGDDGDVEVVAPQMGNILQANIDVKHLEDTMEEMAGAPKEAMGFRSPGEKTAYEVQRLESAASRIFANKITQFEENLVEEVVNAMLELARRRISAQTIKVFNDDFKVATFLQLTAEDLTGTGRIKPIAARHFAERAELVQNLTNFYQSAIGQDQSVRAHISSINMAKLIEDTLDLQDYDLVTPYIRIAEQADAQRLAQAAEQQVLSENMTPSGLTPGDSDQPMPQSALPQAPGAPPQGMPQGAPRKPTGGPPPTAGGNAPEPPNYTSGVAQASTGLTPTQ